MSDDDSPEEKGRGKGKSRTPDKPYRVRLPGFVSDEDIGLGDVMKRATSTMGVTPCRGCGQRAAALNQWVVFSGRRRY